MNYRIAHPKNTGPVPSDGAEFANVVKPVFDYAYSIRIEKRATDRKHQIVSTLIFDYPQLNAKYRDVLVFKDWQKLKCTQLTTTQRAHQGLFK
jgi:hypothetical protein